MVIFAMLNQSVFVQDPWGWRWCCLQADRSASARKTATTQWPCTEAADWPQGQEPTRRAQGLQGPQGTCQRLPSGNDIANWKITTLNGKSHCKWQFSVAMWNYQRVLLWVHGELNSMSVGISGPPQRVFWIHKLRPRSPESWFPQPGVRSSSAGWSSVMKPTGNPSIAFCWRASSDLHPSFHESLITLFGPSSLVFGESTRRPTSGWGGFLPTSV